LIAIVDTGPLYAALDARDRDHRRSLAILERSDLDLVIPALVVAEVCYFAGKNLGSDIEAAFLRGLQALTVEAPTLEDWPLIANLVERYSDFPLGATDASVAVLAERLGTDLIVSLDRRHFAALRTSAGRPFTLLPD
jgi:predicted nucleic acid-binding protein